MTAAGEIHIPNSRVVLQGILDMPENAKGTVLFAHGSGRHSLRNRYVAGVLQDAGIGTLLFDLLTEEEEVIDEQTRHLRFDIALLADRLVGATNWLVHKNVNTNIGYFGASTGAAAALVAAARKKDIVGAVVSRGGRPDLADRFLGQVRAPTLLIVGGDDEQVIGMNQEAFDKMELLKDDEKRLEIVPGATHLFEEEGKLEEVAGLASRWFSRFLAHKPSIQEAS